MTEQHSAFNISLAELAYVLVFLLCLVAIAQVRESTEVAENVDRAENDLVDYEDLQRKFADLTVQYKELQDSYSKAEEQLSHYEKQGGGISDIPPDCSRAGLTESYLFEAILLDADTIVIQGSPVEIADIPKTFSAELKAASEHTCVYKVKLFIDREQKASVVLSAEKKLQRHFYVVKRMLE